MRVDYIIYLPKKPKYILVRIYGGKVEAEVNFESVPLEELERYLENDIAVINLRLSDLYDPPKTSTGKEIGQSEFSTETIESMLKQVAGFVQNLTVGGVEFLDIKDASIKERLLNLRNADKTLTGSSHGAFLALSMATHSDYKNLFDGYISEMGASYAIVSENEDSDFKNFSTELKKFMESYLSAENKQPTFLEYLDISKSPVLRTNNISKKMLLIHGLLDNRVNIFSNMLFYAMTPPENKKFIELYFDRYMGHDAGRNKKSRDYRINKIIDFIQHIKTESDFREQNDQMLRVFYQLRKAIPPYEGQNPDFLEDWSLTEQLNGYALNAFINNPKIDSEKVLDKFLLQPHILFELLSAAGIKNIDDPRIIVLQIKNFLKNPEEIQERSYDKISTIMTSFEDLIDFYDQIFDACDNFDINIQEKDFDYDAIQRVTGENLDYLDAPELLSDLLLLIYNRACLQENLKKEKFNAELKELGIDKKIDKFIAILKNIMNGNLSFEGLDEAIFYDLVYNLKPQIIDPVIPSGILDPKYQQEIHQKEIFQRKLIISEIIHPVIPSPEENSLYDLFNPVLESMQKLRKHMIAGKIKIDSADISIKNSLDPLFEKIYDRNKIKMIDLIFPEIIVTNEEIVRTIGRLVHGEKSSLMSKIDWRKLRDEALEARERLPNSSPTNQEIVQR